MKQNDSQLQRIVRGWVKIAGEDLHWAKEGARLSSSCPWRIIAFHAQQSSEKFLKAFLAFKKVDFPYTHNIARLLELCGPMTGWNISLADADKLTPYGVTARYPAARPVVTKARALLAIKIAENVEKAVTSLLKTEGFKLP